MQYALSTPELVSFHHNMTSFDGGSKTEDNAKSIATDIAKFMAFCDQCKFKWEHLFDQKQLKLYIDKLEKSKLGPDGILTKLDRFLYAIKYVQTEVPAAVAPSTAEQTSTVERLCRWKSTFAQKKLTHTMNVAARESLKDDSSSNIP